MKNKVLIIEDEILARVGLHQLLDWNALGFTLLDDAKDGQEAIRSIENEHPDILLLPEHTENKRAADPGIFKGEPSGLQGDRHKLQ